MANKPAERNTQATSFDELIRNADNLIDEMRRLRATEAQEPRVIANASVMLSHNIELAAQAERRKPKPPVKLSKPDKMWLYVDGKRQIQVDADKAHALAQTYMDQGQSAWLSRKLIRMEA